MQTRDAGQGQDNVFDQLLANAIEDVKARGRGRFKIEHIRDGEVLETFYSPNLIVDEGLDQNQDVQFLGGTQITSWFLMLIDGTPTIDAGDTYASHAGWAEVTAYDEATRPAWTGAAGATGVVTNSANRADFTISTGGATVGGVALVGGGTDADTKGDTAGGGTLFSASAFGGGDRSLNESDVLRVTWEHTYANA